MPKFLEDKLRAEYGDADKTALAWAAGLFEGEGGIGARMVNVAQKDTWVLYKLKELFGGTVGKPRADVSYWWICGQKARDFVKEIYPMLSPRRQSQIDATFLTDERLAARKIISKALRSKMMSRHPRNSEGRFVCLSS